jgi:ubiquinol-cytochrome c reductase cytochrome b subunit
MFHLSLNDVTYVMRAAVFVAPVLAFLITRRICASLQRADRNRVLHGSETGVIVRTVDGRYYEDHVPISDEGVHAHPARRVPRTGPRPPTTPAAWR